MEWNAGPAGADLWVMGRRSELSVPISGNLRANNGDGLLAAAIAGPGIVQQLTFFVADGRGRTDAACARSSLAL